MNILCRWYLRCLMKKCVLLTSFFMLKNSGDGTAAWNLMFAGATISIVPIVVIYIFSSKHFMSGMTAGAVKG